MRTLEGLVNEFNATRRARELSSTNITSTAPRGSESGHAPHFHTHNSCSNFYLSFCMRASTAPTPQGSSPTHAHFRNREALSGLLLQARPSGHAFGVTDLAEPDHAVHHRRHGAVHPVPARRADPSPQAHGLQPEVRAHARHRRGRQDHPSRHLLPDARQLLLRRLLQGGGDPLRLGAADHAAARRWLRLRSREAVGHHVHR